MGMIIAVDGPAASGKGTLARRLASAFNLPYLDTGLLYRAVGRKLLLSGNDPSDAHMAQNAAAALTTDDLRRMDLRAPEADDAASKVAALSEVRSALFDFQRNFPKETGGIIDGRDIGTVIFPDANIKFFITAELETRARRRWLELCAAEQTTTFEQVVTEMTTRDARDTNRVTAPLRAAENAHIIDTTYLSAEEVFQNAKYLVSQMAEQLLCK